MHHHLTSMEEIKQPFISQTPVVRETFGYKGKAKFQLSTNGKTKDCPLRKNKRLPFALT